MHCVIIHGCALGAVSDEIVTVLLLHLMESSTLSVVGEDCWTWMFSTHSPAGSISKKISSQPCDLVPMRRARNNRPISHPPGCPVLHADRQQQAWISGGGCAPRRHRIRGTDWRCWAGAVARHFPFHPHPSTPKSPACLPARDPCLVQGLGWRSAIRSATPGTLHEWISGPNAASVSGSGGQVGAWGRLRTEWVVTPGQVPLSWAARE